MILKPLTEIQPNEKWVVLNKIHGPLIEEIENTPLLFCRHATEVKDILETFFLSTPLDGRNFLHGWGMIFSGMT